MVPTTGDELVRSIDYSRDLYDSDTADNQSDDGESGIFVPHLLPIQKSQEFTCTDIFLLLSVTRYPAPSAVGYQNCPSSVSGH